MNKLLGFALAIFSNIDSTNSAKTSYLQSESIRPRIRAAVLAIKPPHYTPA